ncbi:unnamed protein product, partial [Closterium sp. NIES-54]
MSQWCSGSACMSGSSSGSSSSSSASSYNRSSSTSSYTAVKAASGRHAWKLSRSGGRRVRPVRRSSGFVISTSTTSLSVDSSLADSSPSSSMAKSSADFDSSPVECTPADASCLTGFPICCSPIFNGLPSWSTSLAPCQSPAMPLAGATGDASRLPSSPVADTCVDAGRSVMGKGGARTGGGGRTSTTSSSVGSLTSRSKRIVAVEVSGGRCAYVYHLRLPRRQPKLCLPHLQRERLVEDHFDRRDHLVVGQVEDLPALTLRRHAQVNPPVSFRRQLPTVLLLRNHELHHAAPHPRQREAAVDLAPMLVAPHRESSSQLAAGERDV